jgi:hypothetical protein
MLRTGYIITHFMRQAPWIVSTIIENDELPDAAREGDMLEVIACLEKGVKGKWFGRGQPVHIDAKDMVRTCIYV